MSESKPQRKILVVGGLAAGPSAAAKARRTNPRALLTMFEASETVSYGICEAPYAISDVIHDERKLVTYTPEQLQEAKGIQVKTLHRVEKIVASKQKIVVRNLRTQALLEYEYDKLIIATGASPKKLGVAGENARNVFHLSSREDTLNILQFLTKESPKSAVIIGGGYIGMEMAESLMVRGLDVTLIHRKHLPLSGLETETREKIFEVLQKNKIHFVTNATIKSLVESKDGKVNNVVTNRGSFESDIVIVAVGVAPNIELARTAKIKLGPTGAIKTDERQQTSVDHIYAAGDCCEVTNIVTGKPMYLPLATLASRAAWVAGENASGGHAVFKGAIRAIAVKVFEMEVAQVGISSEEAKATRFSVTTESVSASSRVGIMPGSKKVHVNLIIDQRSHRLLGANVYGEEGVTHRANVLGVAIQHKITIDDIARFDMIYAPPFAPLWDPILVAANQAKKKL